MVHYRGAALKQKIKQDRDGNIGKNIREIRIARGIGQTELVRMLSSDPRRAAVEESF